MSDDDKKKESALIVALTGKPKEEKAVDAGEDPLASAEGLDAATDEVMAAFTTHDVGALKEALKSFVELCRE